MSSTKFAALPPSKKYTNKANIHNLNNTTYNDPIESVKIHHSKAQKHVQGAKKRKVSPRKTPNPPAALLELSTEEQANYVAMDCEFVGVGIGGCQSALARVSIVDWESNILLDTFVQVPQKVTDYRTFVSGITAEDLKCDSAMDRESCVALVKNLIHNKIVIGHGLKSDFEALDLIHHPWQLVRDTAKYEPFLKKTKKPTKACSVPTETYSSKLPQARKLKDLAWTKLQREIQKDGEAHCSVEDAIAALDLYKKAMTKWEALMSYKIAKTVAIEYMLEYETP